MAQVGVITAKLDADAQGWIAGFNKAGAAANAFSTAIGVSLGISLEKALSKIAAFVANTLEIGRSARIQEAAFKAMAKSVGVDADEMLSKIRAASGGFIDLTATMSSMGRLLAQGFRVDQIEQLADAAQHLSIMMGTNATDAMNQLSQAVLVGNTRLLRHVGIYVDAEEAVKQYAHSLGVTSAALTESGRSQAIFQAAMAKAKPTIDALRHSQEEGISAAKRLEVAWEDMRTEIGKAADTVRTNFLTVIMNNWPQIQQLIRTTTDIFITLGKTLLNVAVNSESLIRTAMSGLQSFLDFYNSLPPLVQELGIFGAVLLGKKWAIILAVVVSAGSKIAEEIGEAVAALKAGLPFEDLARMGPEQVKEFNKKIREASEKAFKESGGAKGLLPGELPPGPLSGAQGEPLAQWLARKSQENNELKEYQATLDRVNFSIRDASHAYEMGAAASLDYRNAIVKGIAALKPFAEKNDEAKTRLQELESQLLSFDQETSKLDFEKLQHALTMDMDPNSLGGLEQTAVNIQNIIDRLKESELASSPGFQAMIRGYEAQLHSTDGILNKIRDKKIELNTVILEHPPDIDAVRENWQKGLIAGLDEINRRFQEGLDGPKQYQEAIERLIAAFEDEMERGPLGEPAMQRLQQLRSILTDLRKDRGQGLTPGEAEIDENKVRARIMAGVKEDTAQRIEALTQEIRVRQQMIEDGTILEKNAHDERLKNFQRFLDRELLMEEQKLDTELEMEIEQNNKLAAIIEQRTSQHQRAVESGFRVMIAKARDAGNTVAGTFAGIILAIGDEINKIPTFFDGALDLTRGIFQSFMTGLEDTFFNVMKGNFDDLKDVWKGFLDDILRMLAKFLAEQAVKAFLSFITGDWSSFGGGSGSGLPSILGLGGGGTSGGSTGSQVANAAGSVALKAGTNYLTSGNVLGVGGSGAGAGVTYLISQFSGTPYGIMPGAGLPSFNMGSGAGASAAAATATTATAMYPSNAVVVGAGQIFADAAPAATAAGSTAAGSTATGPFAAFGGAAGAAAFAAPAVLFLVGSILSAQKKAGRAKRLTAHAIDETAQFQEAFGAGTLDLSDPVMALDAEKILLENRKMAAARLGLSPEQFLQVLAQNDAKIQAAFRMNTADLISGKKTADFLPLMQQFGVGDNRDLQDVSGLRRDQAFAALNQVPGFTNLSGEAQTNLANFGAGIVDNVDAFRELIKAVAEMTSGLKLTNEEADLLIEKGNETQAAFKAGAEATAELQATLLDTTNGVGDAKQEAELFAQALVSGQYPAEQLRGILAALAQEHGPEFLKVLEDILLQLGLSVEQVGEILKGFEKLGEGVTVPVRYETQGTPPPGADAPPPPPSTSDHASGGWVTSRYDTVEPDEFVMRRASAMAFPDLMEAMNADPHAAVAALVGAGDKETSKAALKELQAQTRILAEIRDGTRAARTPARVVGARQA